MSNSSKGLEGISAGTTTICTVGQEGNDLKYRGYSIKDMKPGTRFEEIAYLLLYGKLPNATELKTFDQKIAEKRDIPPSVQEALKSIPANAHPMDVVRSGTSLMGCHFEDLADDPFDAPLRLMATLPDMCLIWHLHHQGKSLSELKSQSVAGRFLEGLHGKIPTDEERNMMDVSLILYAEHEFNASTFSARITTSTLSDFYSAITTAIGTLKGPLHGGANEAAMEMLKDFKSVDEAQAFLDKAFASKKKIMGFGHRVYKISDPRSDIIKELTRQLAQKKSQMQLFDISESVEKRIKDEKGLFPNLDFYSASFYYLLDIPIPLYTPLFVFSRLSGWTAHILEQRADNRLIRPTADYQGPDKLKWLPLSERPS